MTNKAHPNLLPFHLFAAHVLRNLLLGICLIGIGLGIGMWGYHHYQPMSWVDAFCNAAMILSGMGPVSPLTTYGGKMFAGFYALFSGLTFIVIIGVVFSPVLKRFLHKVHLDE
jgi:hypothetical protein